MELSGPVTVAIAPSVKGQGTTALVASVQWNQEPPAFTVSFAERIPGQLAARQQAALIARRCARMPRGDDLRVLVDLTQGGQVLFDVLRRDLAGEARLVGVVVEEGEALDWHAVPVVVGKERLAEQVTYLAGEHLLEFAEGVQIASTDQALLHATSLAVLGDPYHAPIAIAASRLWQQGDPEYQARQAQEEQDAAYLAALPPAERAEVLRQWALIAERDRNARANVQRSLNWLWGRGLL